MLRRNMSIIEEALSFAIEAHKDVHRKFDGTAYIKHPLAVMGIMTEYTQDAQILAACILHDTVEDCEDITLDIIHDRFGEVVASTVFYATEKATKADGSRKVRKEIDRQHYCNGTKHSQNLKVADMLDNIPGIVLCDPKFTPIYLEEKRQLLWSLTKADADLRAKAEYLINQMYLILEK